MKILFLLLATTILSFSSCYQREENVELPELAWTQVPDFTALTTPDSLKYLLPILDTVHKRDQFYRSYFSPSNNLKLTKAQQAKVEKLIAKYDKENLKTVSDIIDKHGWLDHKVVGVKANLTLLMVIQHADLKTQQKYLPIINEAMANREIGGAYYAMFIDRVNIGNRMPQKFGTQINRLPSGGYEILPLLNADSLDEWRAQIGMVQTMDQYLEFFKMDWDKEAYKKEHERLMKKYRFSVE